MNGEIEFEFKENQEIELEDILNGTLREMYSIATELKGNALFGKSRGMMLARGSRGIMYQSAQGQNGPRRSNACLLPRI